MDNSVLIISQPMDLHSYVVAEALRRKGVEPALWHSSDFPVKSRETILFEGNRQQIRLAGPDFDLPDPGFATVWNRRPAYVLDKASLHPADVSFADAECKGFRRSLLRLLSPGAFWVNTLDAARRARRKILQHRAAFEAGFDLPATLYTNDPFEIRSFLRRHGGTIVYKPLEAGATWTNEDTAWMTFTSTLTEEELVDDSILASTPGIYQELVPKSYEVRITMMGERALGAKLFSQDTESGKLDWRKSYAELKMEPISVSPELSRLCRVLMVKLGIVFGCFDFIVAPDGRYVFLEVNQMGQFIFVEQFCDLPVLDAFCEFLLQGRVDFDWDGTRRPVKLVDVEKVAIQRMQSVRSLHITNPQDTYWEGQEGGRAREA